MVIAPARTGKDSNNKIAVINTVQTNKGNLLNSIPLHLIFWIVTIKLIAPAIDEMPAKWRLKIAQSTLAPEWAKTPLKGGYTVHPVPTPDSIKLESNNKNKAGGNNQKDKLFNLGNAMSGAPNIIGTNQLPKAPIKRGITIKKIITNACAVTITLYSWVLPDKNWLPGFANSNRINIDNHKPKIPAKAPKIKYKVPISLWFVEQNHRIKKLLLILTY
jgi:hypothetical protein